eukprot:symbB.v1.2.018636.t1/scaffold1495.1/size115473/3
MKVLDAVDLPVDAEYVPFEGIFLSDGDYDGDGMVATDADSIIQILRHTAAHHNEVPGAFLRGWHVENVVGAGRCGYRSIARYVAVLWHRVLERLLATMLKTDLLSSSHIIESAHMRLLAASCPDWFAYGVYVVKVHEGLDGIPPERAVYPLTFHDARTFEADRFVPTYKNGLEFHQQQKFLLAWPHAVAVRLFAGYTFTNMDAGPPGNCGNGKCQPYPVYLFEDEEPRCMPTPTQSPLSEEEKGYEGYVCEHRWEGIGGLVNFRQACRGLPITQIWSSQDGNAELGQFAFRVTSGEHQCFAALVRGDNKKFPNYWGDLGDWRLAGMVTGLPPGRYCDLASLTTQRCWDRRRCPREVLIGDDGIVVTGVVPWLKIEN